MQRFSSKRKLILGSIIVAFLAVVGVALVQTDTIKISAVNSDDSRTNGSASSGNGSDKATTGATANGTAGSNGTKNDAGSKDAGGQTAQNGALSTPTTAGATAPESSTVHIGHDGFSPANLTVKKGTPVAWINDDTTAHALDRADGAASGPHSPQLGGGQSFTYSYAQTGTFTYIDVINPSMTGSVTVTD